MMEFNSEWDNGNLTEGKNKNLTPEREEGALTDAFGNKKHFLQGSGDYRDSRRSGDRYKD